VNASLGSHDLWRKCESKPRSKITAQSQIILFEEGGGLSTRVLTIPCQRRDTKIIAPHKAPEHHQNFIFMTFI
jgi:hypothetical protein